MNIDHYLIQWRYRNPDPMLFNYWRTFSVYEGGQPFKEMTKEQVIEHLPALVEDDKIEVKVIAVSYSYEDVESFL